MSTVLVVGGTGFVGAPTVETFLDEEYDVAVLSRGEQRPTRIDHADVSVHRGDRNDRETLETVRDEVEPDVVIDLAAMYPRHVETATAVFADCDAYVYVSSASAYAQPVNLPSREGDPVRECTAAQATDDSFESYGARKAEGDRICRQASDDGVNAMIVRPVCVYGPHDWSQRHDYWFHRVNTYDEILVPGDGDSTFHRVFVSDLARALSIVAERGTPGEAYNVAERDTAWLDRTIELAATTLETDVTFVHANERELATVGLSPFDFPLYMPIPHLAASEKIVALGWDSTPLSDAFSQTIEEHLESGRTGRSPPKHGFGVDRSTEERLIAALRG